MSTFQYSLNAQKRSLKRIKAKEVKRKVQWKSLEEERDERKRDDLQLNSCAFQGERECHCQRERTNNSGYLYWERILESLGYFTGKEYLNLWDILLGKNT